MKTDLRSFADLAQTASAAGPHPHPASIVTQSTSQSSNRYKEIMKTLTGQKIGRFRPCIGAIAVRSKMIR